MYREWYATEFFNQYAPFRDWVSGQMVQSTNIYDAWLLVVNLSPLQQADIALTFFYENEPPADFSFRLPPRRQGRLHLAEGADNLGTANLPPGCNPRQRFGLLLRSTVPVIAQATVGDRLPNEQVTNSMATFLLHPGPLGELETLWTYVDCLVLTSDRFPLEEREWLTILNPNHVPAHCTLAFLPGGDVDLTGTYEAVNPELGVQEHAVVVPPERILPILLSDLPVVLPNQPYAAQVRSDIPVTVQGIRQIFERGRYAYSRGWAVLDALPTAANPESSSIPNAVSGTR